MTIDDIVYLNYILDIGFDQLYDNVSAPIRAALQAQVLGITFNASSGIGYKDDTVFLLTPDELDLVKSAVLQAMEHSYVLLRNPNNDNYSWLVNLDGGVGGTYAVDDAMVLMQPVLKIPDCFIDLIPKNTLLDLIIWKDKLGRDWLCIDKQRGLFMLKYTPGYTNSGIPYFKSSRRKSFDYKLSNARNWIKDHLQDFHLDEIPKDINYIKLTD